MSILIKGIEMPKNCWDCFACHDGWCIINQKIEGHRTVTHSCPLIEVPPHGRLIDADAYKSLLRGLGDRNYRREKGTICDAIKFLHPHYAPTIIPAEEGE